MPWLQCGAAEKKPELFLRVWRQVWKRHVAKNETSSGARAATTILRSISEGVKTIVTVTERLNDLRLEATATRDDLHRLAEIVYRIAGRLDGIEQRFTEVDKRIELAVKVSVQDELRRRDEPGAIA
jgi:hypothetical protein